MNKKVKPAGYEPPCEECGGRCCGYVALEIDTPTCKTDYDKIRWYLAHQDIHVFVDHDRIWHVEFRTPCEEQDRKKRCMIYEDRPKICREYGTEEGLCEFYDTPYSLYFSTHHEFEAWLESRGKDWRFQRRGKGQ